MKYILTIALAFIVLVSAAQTKKPDTTKLIPFHQNELSNLSNVLNTIQNKIHDIDMSSKKRDTLDAYFIKVQNFLFRRYQTTIADTVKKK